MKMSNPTKLIFTIGLLLTGTILGGCNQQSNATPAQQAPPPPPEVGVIEVQPQPVPITTKLSGRVSPYLIAEVRPQVSGIIEKRLFIEGALVKAGEVLYRIDPATYRAAYASTEAALARAEANLEAARLKKSRFAELVKINGVSQQEYDDAVATLKQVEADILVAKAARDSARINLDYTEVKAPISGRIGRSLVTTGALVTASQPSPLATIQTLDPVYVDVTQSSADLLRLKREMASGRLKATAAGEAKVRLILEDGSSYSETGSLKFSDVTVNQGTGSVTLRTQFPNPDELLLPGMYVQATIELGTMEQALLVPQRGVSRNPAGQALVMVVGAEQKVEPRVIEVSQAIEDSWLVTDGLQPGDQVILEGLQRARPGTVVKPVPFGSPAGSDQPVAAN